MVPDRERKAGSSTHQSLERGLRVLSAVATRSGASSLVEVARRTGLHRSTAHHLLQALVGMGFLRQDPTSRGYEPTAQLFQLTGQSWTLELLAEIAKPFVAELARRSEEGASLAAYRDGVVIIIAKRDSDSPVRVVQDLGTQRPVHATAVGKAILAWLPDAERAGLLAGAPFERFTPRTLVDREALEREVARIRTAGHALDDEEHVEGIRCIAAPVFGSAGRIVASLCVLGPKNRMTRRKIRDLKRPLSSVARALSERLGGHSGPAAGVFRPARGRPTIM